jgi:hypothetical protein
MTPAAVMAGIPADLIRRHDNPADQLKAARQLAQWFNDRGHRPTWAEIEDERKRRASDA